MKKFLALLFLIPLVGEGIPTIDAQQPWYDTPKGMHVSDDEIIMAIHRIERAANGLQLDSRPCTPHQWHDAPPRGTVSTSRGTQAMHANLPGSRDLASWAMPRTRLHEATLGWCHIDDTSGFSGNSLEQIAPKPFYEAIVIHYAVEGPFPDTYIRVLTLDGHELGRYPIPHNGKGHLIIPGNTFVNSVFIYELVVDGQLTMSHEMVLTR